MPMSRVLRLTEEQLLARVSATGRGTPPDVAEFIRETALPGSPDAEQAQALEGRTYAAMDGAQGWVVVKTCRKCGGTKPTSEFASDKSRADGLNVICRHCSALRSKAWREANGEANKQLCKAWYEKNKEKASANNKAWREKNSVSIKAAKKKHQLANLDRCRIYKQNRRALIKSSGGKLSPKLAVRLLKLQRGKCACCKTDLGSDYHLDHIMPLALGGSNTDYNIQILCPPCNQSKQARHPVDFMQSRGMLL